MWVVDRDANGQFLSEPNTDSKKAKKEPISLKGKRAKKRAKVRSCVGKEPKI